MAFELKLNGYDICNKEKKLYISRRNKMKFGIK